LKKEGGGGAWWPLPKLSIILLGLVILHASNGCFEEREKERRTERKKNEKKEQKSQEVVAIFGATGKATPAAHILLPTW